MKNGKWSVLALGLTLAVLLVAGCSSSDDGWVEQTGYGTRIYFVGGLDGRLDPVVAADGDRAQFEPGDPFVLTINGVFDTTLWYRDRPDQEAGEEYLKAYLTDVWPLAYGQVNPNAIVQIVLQGSEELNGLYLEISEPDYDPEAAVLTF